MKKKKTNRFPDYEIVNTHDVITFGTNVWIRKDQRALIIVFPAGQQLHFKPEEEIPSALIIRDEKPNPANS